MEPKVIKFRNGELVIADVKETVDDLLVIENAIAAVPFPMMQGEMVGETFVLKPWIGISNETSFFVRKTEVITICTLKESLLQQYKSYISPKEKPTSLEKDEYEIEEVMEAMFLKSKNLLN